MVNSNELLSKIDYDDYDDNDDDDLFYSEQDVSIISAAFSCLQLPPAIILIRHPVEHSAYQPAHQPVMARGKLTSQQQIQQPNQSLC